MPTASKPGPQRGLSQVSLRPPQGGGGGGSSAQIILQGIAQEQAASQQKLMASIQKLQQQNLQENQAARQSVASGVSEVLNQVVAGQERAKQEETKQREKVEQREFTEEMAYLQADLQRDSQKEAQRIAAQIQGQRDAVNRFIEGYENRRNEVRSDFETMHTDLDALWERGYFDTLPNGTAKFQEMKNQIEMAQARGEDHFNDENLSWVHGEYNKTIQSIIKGQETMDLSQLQRDPFLLPTPVDGRGAKGPTMDPEQTFQWKMTGGYPPEGTMFGPPMDQAPKLVDPDTFREIMFHDGYLAQLTDERNRRKYLDQVNRTTVEGNQRLAPMMERYTETNHLMQQVAPAAVQRGVYDFMALRDPGKFDNVPRNLFAHCMRNVFPQNGDEMASLALDIFDGKEDLRTAQEYYVGMGLESAAFNVSDFLVQQLAQPVEEGGVSMAAVMVEQMVREAGPQSVAQTLGLPPGADPLEGENLVFAQQAMQRLLMQTKGYAERVARGLQKTSALEEFRRQWGKNVRMADILAMHKFLTTEDDRAQAMKLMGDAFQEEVEGMPMGEAGERLEIGAQTPEFKSALNMMDAMILLAENQGPDTLKEMAVMLSGGAEDPTTPNFVGYRSHNERGRRKHQGLDGQHNLVTRRQRARDEAKRGRKTYGQTAQETGAVGVAGRAAGEAVPGAAVGGVPPSQVAKGVAKAGETVGRGLIGEKGKESMARGFTTLRHPKLTQEQIKSQREHEERVRRQGR